MLKDGERMTPKIKEPSGLASALLEGAGKYGLLKLGKRYKNKGLGPWFTSFHSARQNNQS
jgi:hypothetical protein